MEEHNTSTFVAEKVFVKSHTLYTCMNECKWIVCACQCVRVCTHPPDTVKTVTQVLPLNINSEMTNP